MVKDKVSCLTKRNALGLNWKKVLGVKMPRNRWKIVNNKKTLTPVNQSKNKIDGPQGEQQRPLWNQMQAVWRSSDKKWL